MSPMLQVWKSVFWIQWNLVSFPLEIHRSGLEGTTPTKDQEMCSTWLCFLLAMWAWIGHSRLLGLGFHDDSLPQQRAAVVRDDVASQHAFLKCILNTWEQRQFSLLHLNKQRFLRSRPYFSFVEHQSPF